MTAPASQTRTFRPGPRIGSGRTAEIFDAGPGRALKLYRAGWGRDTPDREFHATLIAGVAGGPVAAVHDPYETDGRFGFTMDRLAGPSMLGAMSRRPWTIVGQAHGLADLHHAIHRIEAPDLPALGPRLERRIEAATHVPVAIRADALATLARLVGDARPARLCHGDLHPENVILTAEGPRVIDWVAASSGEPLGDVAMTLLLLDLGEPDAATPRAIRALIGLARGTFGRAYRSRYLTTDEDRRRVRAWLLPVAVGRFGDGIENEYPRLDRLIASLRRT